VAGFFEHGNELSGSIKCNEFFTNSEPAQWRCLVGWMVGWLENAKITRY
jgi:hypothetical protein